MFGLKELKQLVAQMEQYERLYRSLDNARRIDENPETTLARLLRERAATVRMAKQLGFKNRDFDYLYKDNLEFIVEEIGNEAANRREQKLREAAQEDSGTGGPDSP